MIVGRQIRAARALLDMSQDSLAEATGLTPQAIRKIENGETQPREGTIATIMRAFDVRGLEFTENSGVKLKTQGVEIFEGTERFNDFYDFLYEHLKKHGGDVCIGNSDPHLYKKYHKKFAVHKSRMEELTGQNDVHFRILIKEGDQNFTASSYAEYKWQTEKSFSPTSFYAFGECLALISFVHSMPPYVILIKSGPLAESYRQSFNISWEQATTPKIKEEKL
ncbi:MAG: helix-turn-helix transcriptional regulator [Alphaproteobacteria bacterium]|nr:helix-turn-helix transcriptional regulator [Alphaproteobacteria bacterium]